jgi:hypothetical protein
MGSVEKGALVDISVFFAFPMDGGKWLVRRGTLSAIENTLYRIMFAGFETQAGEGSRLTATYNIAQNLRSNGSDTVCEITQIVTVDGKVSAKISHAGSVKVLFDPLA